MALGDLEFKYGMKSFNVVVGQVSLRLSLTLYKWERV